MLSSTGIADADSLDLSAASVSDGLASPVSHSHGLTIFVCQYKGIYQLLHFSSQAINIIIVKTEKITLCYELYEKIIPISLGEPRQSSQNVHIVDESDCKQPTIYCVKL